MTDQEVELLLQREVSFLYQMKGKKHIVHIYDHVFESHRNLHILMEKVRGFTLKQIVCSKAMANITKNKDFMLKLFK